MQSDNFVDKNTKMAKMVELVAKTVNYIFQILKNVEEYLEILHSAVTTSGENQLKYV